MAEIAGLKLIVPSSVAGSGVSVSASGKVSFTAATSVSVNGCFSSTYDNYLVVMKTDASVSSVSIQFRLRLSGTDAATSTYIGQNLRASSTTVTGYRDPSALSYTSIAAVSSTITNGLHTYIYGPALAQPTALRTVSVSGLSSATIDDNANTHSVSTAYDGFTFYPQTGSLTGSLPIYGLSQ